MGLPSTTCTSLHDAVAVLAIVAQHHATPSRTSVGTSRPLSNRQHTVRPRGERPVVGHDDHPHLEVPRRARRTTRAAVRRSHGRGCPTAHRLIIQPDPPPAPARPPCVAARRPTTPPGGGASDRSSPRARAALPRGSAPARAHPANTERHHHVLERRELAQQVVELKDEPDDAVSDACRDSSSGSVATGVPRSPRSPRVGRSSAPRTCSSVLFPAPLAPTIATISPGATVRFTPDSTGSNAPSPPRYDFQTSCASSTDS